MMFSKALFKQSCKANGMMWAIIAFAECFMLACVMIISGSGGIGDTKNAIQDTIIVKEIDSSIEKKAVNYYKIDVDGLKNFDTFFAKNTSDGMQYYMLFKIWDAMMPKESNYSNNEEFMKSFNSWYATKPAANNSTAKLFLESYNNWILEMPKYNDFGDEEAYKEAMTEWHKNNPCTEETLGVASYTASCNDLQEYVKAKALALSSDYDENSNEFKEMFGMVMFSINPNGMFNDMYTNVGEKIPSDYDVTSIVSHIMLGDVDKYLSGKERETYRLNRATDASSIFIASNLTNEENVKLVLDQLSSFGVTKEKYDSFGYTYKSTLDMAKTCVITYRNLYEYEVEQIEKDYADGNITKEEYEKQIALKSDELTKDITSSLLSSLPQEVSEALEEVGQLDLYSLIVGDIFYKLAGLLLPIIYVIMTSINLIAGQVDSGSMAYILSTSTKRKTIVFTQSLYLILSVLAMFTLTTITGGICLCFVSKDITLTFGKFVLLNVGAFLVLFALSGLCFFTSCWFDRSKRAMSIGGGLSIFALVAAMLGLFGSEIIPSVIRLDALNAFNYVTVITLFDVISIVDGTGYFIYKLVILFALGLAGYIVGSTKFIKKDLPL